MAIFQVHMNSYTLRMETDLTVIIPSSIGWDRIHGTNRHIDYPEKFKVLYFFHGFGGDYFSTLYHTRIAEYAQKYQIAVVMPSGYNAAYTDMKYGPEYTKFYNEELHEFINRMFPVSDKVEDTFIAGFSMGGYGALVNGIGRPDVYSAAASIACTLNVDARIEGQTNTIPSMVTAMYGNPPIIDRNTQDVFVMLENAIKNNAPLPRLFACSGTEDQRAYPRFKMLEECCERIGLDMAMETGPGVHDWTFTDKWLPRVIEWLLNK